MSDKDSWEFEELCDGGVLCVRGHAWIDGSPHWGRFLAKQLVKISRERTLEELAAFLSNLHGYFAVIAVDQKRHTAIAHIDRLRSVPIYWAVDETKLHLASSAISIAEMGGAFLRINEESVDEELQLGYLTADNTLYQNISQAEAASSILFKKFGEESRWTSNIEYYDAFWREEGKSENWEQEFRDATDHVIDRLVALADGRRIVIPLSGGTDSRLIAAGLKRAGVKNVICFTYWDPRHWEVEESKKVAQSLGYEWHHFPISRSELVKGVSSSEFGDYLDFASKGAGGVVAQDWFVVRKMRNLGIVNSDDLFVPGHAGDFAGGRHTQTLLNHVGEVPVDEKKTEDFVRGIFKRHYLLWGGETRQTCLDRWGKRIEKSLPNSIGSYLSDVKYVACQDWWAWRERQSKYIVNSCRAYEWIGASWAAPLWDEPYWDFWKTVPMELRLDNCYDKWAQKHYFVPMGIPKRELTAEDCDFTKSRLGTPGIWLTMTFMGIRRVYYYAKRLGLCRSAVPFARATLRESQVYAAEVVRRSRDVKGK